mmetsp:Transcript_27583/g.81189  ORF Transcript_27583/g.81189 Transcript_27583/m.81189 type:complete len:188 (-) Transcript_27583:164-727(-)
MPGRSSLDKPLLPPVVAGEPLTDSARAHGLWEPLAAIPSGARLKRRDGEPLTDSEYVLWEGSTWERCCWPCCCCAPCCCVASHWTLTSRRFDKRHGCCGMSEDTLDLRRIADVHFDAGAFPCCLCTGVVRVFAPADIDAEEGGLVVDTYDARTLFSRLKFAWTQASAAAIGVERHGGGGDGGDHHAA